MTYIKKILATLTVAFLAQTNIWAQNILTLNDTLVIDKVVGVVGNKPILESSIQEEFRQMKVRNMNATKCQIYESMLYQKLLVTQADLDSISVSEKEVEQQLQSDLQIMINQAGGVERLEESLNKPLGEIKDGLRDITEDKILADMERSSVVKDVKVSPSEVHNFYKALPKDSLPLIDLQLEMAQIVFYPEISDKDIEDVKKRLLSFKEDVEKNGALFETKAILYSEDQASATSGGELGMTSRNDLVPEISAVAFQLKKDSISDVVKTDYGYHIIQMIDRKGERINVRHILLKPKFTPEARMKARQLADSVYKMIHENKLTFEDAAKIYSQDDKTKRNGGIMLNRMTGDTKFEVDHIYPAVYYNIKNLTAGEYTKPFETYDDLGTVCFKIMLVKSKEAPHVASIETDYQTIQDMALNKKHREAYNKWVGEKAKSTYVKIAPEYKTCPFDFDGWINNDILR